MKKDSPNTPPKEEMWKPAPSLNPGTQVIEACAERKPHPRATAIQAAWRFKHPVKKLTPEAYAALIEKCTITF